MDYKRLAEQILELVGGKENVSGLVHCSNRLRFNLKDESKAQTDALKKTKGVVGVAKSGGQYQVIIGSDVANVFAPLNELCDLKESRGGTEREKIESGNGDRYLIWDFHTDFASIDSRRYVESGTVTACSV